MQQTREYKAVNFLVQARIARQMMMDKHLEMLRAGYRESYPGSQEFVREE